MIISLYAHSSLFSLHKIQTLRHTSNRKGKDKKKKGKCKGKQPSSIERKIEKENVWEKKSVMEIQELRCHNLSITLLECRMSCSVITQLVENIPSSFSFFSFFKTCKSQLT